MGVCVCVVVKSVCMYAPPGSERRGREKGRERGREGKDEKRTLEIISRSVRELSLLDAGLHHFGLERGLLLELTVERPWIRSISGTEHVLCIVANTPRKCVASVST